MIELKDIPRRWCLQSEIDKFFGRTGDLDRLKKEFRRIQDDAPNIARKRRERVRAGAA